jgi:hypothetical protein
MKTLAMGWKGLLIATAAVAVAIGIPTPGRAYGSMSVGIVDSLYYSKDVGAETTSPASAWKGLGRKKARIAVPFDIAQRPDVDTWRKKFNLWLWGVVSSGAEPYVTFMTDNPPNWTPGLSDTYNSQLADRPGSGHCIRLSTGDQRCHVPDANTFGQAVEAFVRAYPGVKVIGAWNEPDIPYAGNGAGDGDNSRRYYMPDTAGPSSSDPHFMYTANCPSNHSVSNCGPELAARYWAIAKFEQAAVDHCGPPQCLTVAGEFYGKAPLISTKDSDEDGSSHGNYGYWGEYEKYLAAADQRPYVWAIHPYGDSQAANATQASLSLNGWTGNGHFLGKNSGFYTTSELPNNPKSHLWLTAAGVPYTGNEGTQANTLLYWITNSNALNGGGAGSTADTVGRLPRLYVYNYENCSGCTGPSSKDWGLVSGAHTRKAYDIVKFMAP